MKLLEYKAKSIPSACDTLFQEMVVKSAGDEIAMLAEIKSQVPIGGRGKPGGIVKKQH